MYQLRRMFTAALAATGIACASASAADIKVGIIVGFTGPTESEAPNYARAAEIAADEINRSGLLLGGSKIVTPHADSTCIDSSAAVPAAERLVSSDKIVALVGADCSGVTAAIVNNVTKPNGVLTISPSATSPALTGIAPGYFYRTAPSDARLGQVITDMLMKKNLKEVAVSYSNSDYGKAMTDSFSASYKAAGGTITLAAPHDDGKADYSAEVAALAAAGGDLLVVFGYADQGGLGIVRQSLESGAFSRFAFGDGMYYQSLLDAVGKDLEGSIGAVAGSEGKGGEAFDAVAKAAGFNPNGVYRREYYDAMALIGLAIQKAGSTDRKKIRDALESVANAPGEKIYPGELAKGLQILKDGGDIDYVGATNVEFDKNGDVGGSYREYVIKGGKFETVGFH
ncbi:MULTISPECIES: ABC transporter substrate-binding protein [unclassified Mesorhizobium]|uniref:ABC transporter substrate-binding protein n=1 Tax=unclassified Mesorhizobium TaxID=325217 RepID=UPI002414EDD9|nr:MULTISPECIES: ABC transporter substrate-binding protein [unclassified Mesorhizobium]MDG4890070.1 ABC transporter substrate-binding protein [Mesorhizobium sp. WSM4887]MDG4904212.1 ABC transporter substrate-binding protein [Mesorhizobium sp. WSM4962]MDG4909239.1 ABC transporter substrate-binding protein [Mesorhizobium sp. WSM4898]MDG4921863.1 ABC transporter substrate-binding protein [Mesorhizobium sp. WSM4989]